MIDRDKLIETLMRSLVGTEWVPPGWTLSFIVAEIHADSCDPRISLIETSDPVYGIPICIYLSGLVEFGKRLSHD